MAHVILLGAGFSRNWGGWLAFEAFEYLLGCPEISGNQELIALLWQHQPNGGYESALTELQQRAAASAIEDRGDLDNLEAAIARMFRDMNAGYFDHNWFEFQEFRARMVGTFLAKFDAIFTLNQDLLLEHYYFDNNVPSTANHQRWNGAQLPGMRRIRNLEALNQNSWTQCSWTPTDPVDKTIDVRLQPYYKIHGSSNWKNQEGGSLLIMGGNKVRAIDRSPVLSWYHQQFTDALHQPDARLMIIGYGFMDSHINDLISVAATLHGLRFFVIDPRGGEIGMPDMSSLSAQLGHRTQLQKAFERSLIGASRRPLRDIFGGDSVEHNKIMRFFDA